ncbi:MAG: hypothetical protein ACTSPI_00710 [Candidatus Heimdallarchaeaceae archaeon]
MAKKENERRKTKDKKIEKLPDIKIEITVTPDVIKWKANVDSIAMIFYLTRVIHFINKELDKGKE